MSAGLFWFLVIFGFAILVTIERHLARLIAQAADINYALSRLLAEVENIRNPATDN